MQLSIWGYDAKNNLCFANLRTFVWIIVRNYVLKLIYSYCISQGKMAYERERKNHMFVTIMS